jgi:uncharacterized protein (DUF2235 family)
MKNIVICCDGTGNEYGDARSNVIHLYKTLIQGDSSQVNYYHPGVGTMGDTRALTQIGKTWTKIRGLAFGYGLSENIADAYRYLMKNYEVDDQVFIFGFSRGAYMARALCGMLEMFGLLAPGNEGQIPYAMRLYKRHDGVISRLLGKPNKFRVANGFKSTFCRPCKPHFLGLWDTVSSVGWILDPIGMKPDSLPFTAELADVKTIRHAISLDEHRAFFRANLVKEIAGRDLKQIWFPGVHSDVGGSYPEAESGLAKISLRWMLREAMANGLRVDQTKADTIFKGDPSHARPLSTAIMHNSLNAKWWIGEFYPKSFRRRVSAPGVDPPEYVRRIRFNLFRRRYVPDGSSIHASVIDRQRLIPEYKPTNLPAPGKFLVATDCETEPASRHLEIGETAVIGIFASLKWNDTALQLYPGERYKLEANGRWYDATIPNGPDGNESTTLFMRLTERFRRRPSSKWFTLIGAIGTNSSGSFVIGSETILDVQSAGALQCYANDLPWFYFNNSNFVTLSVTRVPPQQNLTKTD